MSGSGIEELLAQARSRLDRLSARDAWREVRSGAAWLVDIRPAAQRAEEGQVAPGLEPRVIERNVLEWRFDPRQDAVLPGVNFDTRIIVMCQEGYTSSLAADALRSLGLSHATDLVGGFAAWRGQGLPIGRPPVQLGS